MTSSRSLRSAIYATLATIAILSGSLRLWGIQWGLPTTQRFTTLYVDEYTPLWVLES